MKCPNCTDTTLVLSERQGVEIDYCPTCRGIWLDRGELDKLLDKAANAVQAPLAPAAPHMDSAPRRKDFEDSDYNEHKRYGQRRKKSWLNEIFD